MTLISPPRWSGTTARLGPLLAAIALLAACDSSTEPRTPAAIEIVGGEGQSGVVAAALAVAPTVRVVTRDGKPVSGVLVSYSVSAGGGSVAGSSSKTDRSGIAYVGQWTLGNVAGPNTLAITSSALPQLTLHATALPDVPAALDVSRQPPAAAASGAPFPASVVVRLLDRFGNVSARAGVPITAVVVESGATLANASATTDANGEATFTDLVITAPAGSYTLEFRSPGLTPGRASLPVVLGTGTCAEAGAGAFALDLPLGGMVRRLATAADAPACLSFDLSRAAGQQYLLLFENMPLLGDFDGAVFYSSFGQSDTLRYTVRGAPTVLADAATPMSFRRIASVRSSEPVETQGWDFGDGGIYEGRVQVPPTTAVAPMLIRKGSLLSLSAVAEPAIGDTVVVLLEGISRLGIPTGQQKAVIRYISGELIFAEDVRLGTLARDTSGATNTPLTVTVMDSISREYAAYARVQGDLFFQGRFNAAVEASPPPRVLAVHTLMYAKNIWGYTYMSGRYFAFDYWVGSDGSTRGFAQEPQRLADNLFMHEIAHIRHYGMLERLGRTQVRGNQWAVEGFARFSERLPIANRLLGSVTPSRTNNLVLPRNPIFNNGYYFDDVPTYLQAGSVMFGGYGASSYVFDYLADQVALAGGDYLAALRDVLTSAGTQSNLDAAVARWLPAVGSFTELFTRARIALYTDDYDVPLPAWTQYQQFQLRASRPPGTQAAADPRNAWPRVRPGESFVADQVELPPGAARGLLIRGDSATASAKITIETNHVAGGVISITRIR